MARIINMADPDDDGVLCESTEAAEKKLSAMVQQWEVKDWEVTPHPDEPNRYTVVDDSGQFIGEFCIVH